jgi:DNA-binding transcriptional LysR family regulator
VPNTARANQQRSMNCRFDDILTFINVLEAGSITSAAARLNASKSAISRRISDLEAALRVAAVSAIHPTRQTDRACAVVLRADCPVGPRDQ